MNGTTQPQDPQNADLLTVAETAQLLRIGRNRTYELLQHNELPFIRFGKRYLIPRQSLLMWITQTAQASVTGNG